MFFARCIAVVLFLQGVGPLLLLGAWRPGGWFLLGTACIYTVLSIGFWRGRRWALRLALALTLPQLMIVSSPLLSWRFHLGASFGMGVCPAWNILDAPTFSYHSRAGA